MNFNSQQQNLLNYQNITLCTLGIIQQQQQQITQSYINFVFLLITVFYKPRRGYSAFPLVTAQQVCIFT